MNAWTNHIDELLGKITPYPWKVTDVPDCERPGTVEVCDLVNDCWVIGKGDTLGHYKADAEFIANAPANLEKALNELAAMKEALEYIRDLSSDYPLAKNRAVEALERFSKVKE